MKRLGAAIACLVAAVVVGVALVAFIDTALLLADEYIVAALVAALFLIAMVLGTKAAREEGR